MDEWNEKAWKIHVRESFDGEKRYDLNAPSCIYVFNEKDFLELTRNINAVAEHIHDKEYYYIHDGDIFRRDGGQLLGVIEDCKELNRLYKENMDLKRFKEVVFDLIDAKIKLYSHKPVSAPISQPMSVNFDADVDRLARLSELELLKEELQE